MVLAVAGGAVAGPFEDAMAAYEADDYATALQLFRPLAAQGDVKAQYLLGIMYLRGIGVEQEYAGALNWLRKAADQGDAEAQIGLGFLYDNGVSKSSSAVMRERSASERRRGCEVVSPRGRPGEFQCAGTLGRHVLRRGRRAAGLRRCPHVVQPSGG